MVRFSSSSSVKNELLQLLNQRLARLILVIDVVTSPVRPARLAFHPLPVQTAAVVGGVDDEVLADGLGDDLFDFLAGGMVREGVLFLRCVLVDDHAALVGDGLKNESAVRDRGFRIRSSVVPAELADEQGAKVKILQVFFDPDSVEGPWHVSYRPPRPDPWSK